MKAINAPKRIMIVDVETAGGLGTPFIYDVGFIIATLHDGQYIPLEMKSYVVEQVWSNKDLFDTAYYAEKRNLYVSKMRGRTSKLKERHLIWGKMRHLIKKYDVEYVLAYNYGFDGRAFNYNSGRYQLINPLETLSNNCIWMMSLNTICKEDNYLKFCQEHIEVKDKKGNPKFLSESKKSYSTSAESVYSFLKNTPTFVEEHTGLEDSIIELEILNYIVENYEVDFEKTYKKVYPPEISEKNLRLEIVDERENGKNKVYYYKYNKMQQRGKSIKLTRM